MRFVSDEQRKAVMSKYNRYYVKTNTDFFGDYKLTPLSNIKIRQDGKTSIPVERYADGSIALYPLTNSFKPKAVIRADNFPTEDSLTKEAFWDEYGKTEEGEKKFFKLLKKKLHPEVVDIMIDEIN